MNVVLTRRTIYRNLGLIDYKEAWDYQTTLFDKILSVKGKNRNAGPDQQEPTSNYLLFCEHPHVYTLGKTGKEQNLLLDSLKLGEIGATYYHINRGGDITYHGPGQIVVYPVIDLENFFTDIHRYMRLLEEAVIRTCTDYGVSSGRINGLTGVWVGHENEKTARKICAFGVKTSRWVTMHGLAFNVNTDLGYFNHIVPCGISDKAVTSLERETGKRHNTQEAEDALKHHLSVLFQMELV